MKELPASVDNVGLVIAVGWRIWCEMDDGEEMEVEKGGFYCLGPDLRMRDSIVKLKSQG